MSNEVEKGLGQKFDEWAGILFLILFIGIPVLAYSLLKQPVETIKWIRRGGGHPRPGNDETHR